MADPTLPSVVSKMSSLVDAWRTYITQVRDWLAGTSTGGPGSDGSYPLTDDMGTTVFVPSPAAQAARVDAVVDSAQSYATAADTSAAAAATSAMNAAASESTAGTHRDDAQTSANLSQTYATASGNSAADARSAATDSQTARDAAAASAASMDASVTSAADSATAAHNSEVAAAASAAASDASATSAAGSATDAYASALTAQTYATGVLRYMGAFDASTGSFPANPTKGDFWKISVAGTVGGVDLAVGDQIIYNGTGWDKIDNTESVTSVAGRVGAVVISKDDIAGLQTDLDALAPLASPQFTGSVGIGPGDPAKLTTITSDTDLTFNHANGYSTANMRWTFAGVTNLLLNKLGDLTATGRVISQAAHFDSSINAVVLGCAAGGMVYLRPDGVDNSAGQVTLDSAGGFTNNGAMTVNCVSASDAFQVNKPGSSPAGSYVGISSPGGVPGIIGLYSTTKRRDIQFTNTGIQLAVSTGTGGVAPQFTFGENGGFTATGPIDASNISTGIVANTVAERDGAGDLFCRLIRCNYPNEAAIASTAGLVFRNSTTDNFHRTCSNPAAVRNWMGLYVQSTDPGAVPDGTLWAW